MKIIAAILLFACVAAAQDKAALTAAEAACGPREMHFTVKPDPSQHPTPPPGSGKALLYVVQEDRITTRFAADGKWVGANKGRTYFFIQIDPGEHHLCAMRTSSAHGPGTRVSLHELKAESGKTYYFSPRIYSHVYVGASRFDLSLVDPDEGKALVANGIFSTWAPK